jgi:antitoxin MazE
MVATVKKWGNSLGLRLPNAIVKGYSLEDGSKVELQNVNNGIFILPKRKTSLDTLIAGITSANKHEEIETGKAVGNEIW